MTMAMAEEASWPLNEICSLHLPQDSMCHGVEMTLPISFVAGMAWWSMQGCVQTLWYNF